MEIEEAERIVQEFKNDQSELSDDEVLEMFERGSGVDVDIEDLSDLNGSGEGGRLKPGDTAPNGKKYHASIYWYTNRIAEGYSPIAIFCGQEGSGKSMAALRFVMDLYEIGVLNAPFTPDKVQDILCYDVVEYLVNFLTHRREAELMDEAGSKLNSKDWNQKFNRAIDKTTQTQRLLENLQVYILPVLSDLEGTIRRRPDGVFHCLEPGKVSFTGYKYKYDEFGRKDADNRISFSNFSLWTPDLPPEDVRKAYRMKEGSEKRGILIEAIEEAVAQKIEEEEERNQSSTGGLDSLQDIEL